MAYSALTDIQGILPDETLKQITDDVNGTTIIQVKIDKAISDADEVINSYIGNRYQLPLSSPYPKLVIKLSTDIAIYNLYRRRSGIATPEIIIKAYDEAMKMLRDIQTGKAILSDATTNLPVSEPSVYVTNKTDEDRIFTKSLLDQM